MLTHIVSGVCGKYHHFQVVSALSLVIAHVLTQYPTREQATKVAQCVVDMLESTLNTMG